MNLNKVFLIGRLTRDPELRSTTSGQKICGFSMATNRTWHDKQNQKQEETEFHDIVSWGKLAEIISQFTKKGDTLFVDGRLCTRKWKDKQNNVHRATEIIAETVQLGPKPPIADEVGVIPSNDGVDEVSAEDLPF